MCVGLVKLYACIKIANGNYSIQFQIALARTYFNLLYVRADSNKKFGRTVFCWGKKYRYMYTYVRTHILKYILTF